MVPQGDCGFGKSGGCTQVASAVPSLESEWRTGRVTKGGSVFSEVVQRRRVFLSADRCAARSGDSEPGPAAASPGSAHLVWLLGSRPGDPGTVARPEVGAEPAARALCVRAIGFPKIKAETENCYRCYRQYICFLFYQFSFYIVGL